MSQFDNKSKHKWKLRTKSQPDILKKVEDDMDMEDLYEDPYKFN